MTISAQQGLINQYDYFDKQVASLNLSNYFIIKKGEFAYNKSYSNGYPYGAIKRLDFFEQGALSSLYICFSINNVNSDYLLRYFDSGKWNKQVVLISGEGARNHGLLNLSSDDFFNINMMISPSREEQMKISHFLNLIFSKIKYLERKIDVLKKYKEGILKTLSKQGKTFVLRDIICEENVRTKTSNEYPILSSTSEGIFLQNDYFNHQVASNNNAGYKIVKKNQVVFSPQNLWLGNINLNDKFEIGAVSPSYKVYSLKRDLIDPYYFIEYMKSPYMLYQYKLCSKQGASVVRRNLDIDSFLRIKIKLPTLENQQTIKILQHHISNLKNLLQKLIKIKKYLLANMFI